ncbi:MAG: Chromosomal replication initiator protein DnaA [candidate division WS2 bacterium]|uniref:Chromosomal replication initiator protein DnaA n=1 Tax=Psychracetigena formicireducens TaxID=2986056 RepID=A0A9E2F1X6_PSYF1|nr:Chromosomal replication initiator protein DnaA [Candidatus Psychracetigena formicireducens]
MARPLRIEYAGAFYHIIQRGNERKEIFKSDQDREKFLKYIELISGRYNIRIHTYCIMNNHFHLILETIEPNLAKAMHTLNTSYTVYFNTKRKRTGHLFQGRYKAILVQADEYLHHLSRYIHLNPIRAELVKDPKDYPWSSYKFFLSEINSPGWLKTDFILSMFDKDLKKARVLYRKFVIEHIGNEIDVIKDNITAGSILANHDFVEWIRDKFIKDKSDREIPDIERLKKRPSLADIISKVKEAVKDEGFSRKIAIYLSRKYTAKTLNEIASFYGNIGDTGVSQLCLRLERKRKEDRQLNNLISQLEKVWNVET